MMFTSFPPAGNPILLKRMHLENELLPGYHLVWVDSGTSALAWSLLDIKSQVDSALKPKVVVPGYCCPDLISAALYAGFEPVIIDINKDESSYNLEKLKLLIEEQAIHAIIAVNFLGIKEQIDELKSMISETEIKLIEDNAQWFPEYRDEPELNSDYITFSFGRGKAVSLLGGGLAAVKNYRMNKSLELGNSSEDRFWKVKVWLYQMLTKPAMYYWIEKLPVLKLGETVYHPLESIRLFPASRKEFLWSNIEEYRKRSRDVEFLYRRKLNGNLLNPVLNTPRSGRCLRYPYLFKDQQTRNKAHSALLLKGLGSSVMYGTSLSDVEGVYDIGISTPKLENASDFASRLLTLPTHSGVSLVSANSIVEIINKVDS